jgi:hypothetical protein
VKFHPSSDRECDFQEIPTAPFSFSSADSAIST